MQLDADGVVAGGEFFHPFVHHLGVAQLTELAKELFGHAAHLVPGGIGIDLLKDCGDGAASSDGDAEIMHGVGCGLFADVLEFLEDALHPMSKTTMLGLGPG